MCIFAVPKRGRGCETRRRKRAETREEEGEREARKKIKKVLAEMKKDSHLCSPKTGQPKKGKTKRKAQGWKRTEKILLKAERR